MSGIMLMEFLKSSKKACWRSWTVMLAALENIKFVQKIIWFRLRGVGLSELLLTFPRGLRVFPPLKARKSHLP